MNTETVKVLLVEDNPGDARLIKEFLKEDKKNQKNFEIRWVTSLRDSLDQKGLINSDIVLADLGLPDSQGLGTLIKLLEVYPRMPVIVITGLDDHKVGIDAVQAGAQDYLVKGQIDEQLLVRTIYHAIERNENVNQKQLITKILSILNRHNNWQKLIGDILIEIKEYIGIEAVGIRLKKDGDYPYFESNGFSQNFIKSENYLYVQNETGGILKDEHGNPVLECMCGNILQRRFDPSLPFFTEAGSYWTNSTTKLLAETSETNRQSCIRNRCLREGYESVALIPLQTGDEVIGLLQLNDRQPYRFTIHMIRFFEEIGLTLGIAFHRMEAEQKIRLRINELNLLHNLSIIGEISTDQDDFTNGLLQLLPMGFQYPDKISFRLEIEGKNYQLANFKPSANMFSAEILFHEKKIGKFEVVVIEDESHLTLDPFLHEERELIITISKQIGDYIGRKRSEQIQQVIYKISQFTNTSSSLEELVMFIQIQLSALIDTTNFYIAMYNAATDYISIPYFADQKDDITSFPSGKTLTAYVIKTKKSLLAKRAVLDRLSAEGKIETIGEKAQVWLGIPLSIKGEVIGVFAVQSYSDELAYTEYDMSMLEMISQQISISLERKMNESDLKVALDKAQESDRVKSAFLANMSHEFRTPLNAVIGFSQLIDTDTSREDILEFIKHILKGGYNLLEIIEEILNISLLEGGSIAVNKHEHSLSDIMNDVEKMIRDEQEKMQKHKLTLVYHASDFDSLQGICTDVEKVKQVLMILLKNALKFTPEGTIEYGVLKEVRENKLWLKFYVRDTGIGISDDAQKIIFDLFRQVEESHTRTYGGAGLGLSVCKKLVELLGGSIWVESTLGKGSTFLFTMPFESGNFVKTQEKQYHRQEKEMLFAHKTVLIAEDEDSNYELLEILLKTKGFIVLWARNGLEATQLASEHPELDLILMDLKMPVMNGYEATKQIRITFPNLPIIAQTAYALPEERKTAIMVGCNDLITKPIEKEQLFKLLYKYLN